jgi:Signal transduction histidine kinase
MLINILSNAIKFTPENGNVEFTAKTVREMIVFTVQDNGIGIPKKDLNRIGLPFEQVETDLHRQNPGTGLGLALTRSFAELHGGKLELFSEEGVGTTVSIYIPLTPPEETQLLAAE